MPEQPGPRVGPEGACLQAEQAGLHLEAAKELFPAVREDPPLAFAPVARLLEQREGQEGRAERHQALRKVTQEGPWQ